MRWIFIFLLLINAIYFGWEFDRQIKIDRKNQAKVVVIAPGSEELKLLS